MNEELKKAIEILNKYDYIAIPISKGQMCLCDACTQDEAKCRYNSIGYTCTNLRCINEYIRDQIDYKAIISQIK